MDGCGREGEFLTAPGSRQSALGATHREPDTCQLESASYVADPMRKSFTYDQNKEMSNHRQAGRRHVGEA